MTMTFKIGIFAFIFVLAGVVISPPVLYGEERTHTVQRGETFFSIARSFGLRAEDLMRHNGITDPTRLLVGQRIRIPAAVESQTSRQEALSAEEFINYRVVRGDTLFGIARRFSVTVAAIQEANNLSQNHILREGATLRIPTRAGAPAETMAPVETRPPNVITPVPPVNITGVPPRGTGAAGTGTLDPSVRWPINARAINYMTGRLQGVVITGTRSEPVLSLTRGTVLSAGPYRGFGRVVIVQAEGGYLFVYGGNETLSVREGDRVGPGTELGRLGLDAMSNTPQLFFMVYRNNVPVNPATAPRA